MPEGPELHLASHFVNEVCKGRVFAGPIVKSEVSTKNPDIPWPAEAYTISATSRGKEVRLTLTSTDTQKTKSKKPKPNESINILFRFGMSGKFQFTAVNEMHKHAHLNFFTRDEPKQVLSFVDYRRFGRWEVTDSWGADRGPCVMFEYDKFRDNVLNNLKNAAFNKPICEALLNQKFFNGIGNYLRAEILYRLGIPPFEGARSVLEPLTHDSKVKKEIPDILELCNILPHEVINLGGKGYDPEGRSDDYDAFASWLRCYYNTSMNNMVDHNGRTIWFSGPAGPMTPKEEKSRGVIKRAKGKKYEIKKEEENSEVVDTKTKVKKPSRGRNKKSPPVATDKPRGRKKLKSVGPNNDSIKQENRGSSNRVTRSSVKKTVGTNTDLKQEQQPRTSLRTKKRSSNTTQSTAISNGISSLKRAKTSSVETAEMPTTAPKPKRRSAKGH
ncbi:endonuclease 8-like 1 [Lingula anatina]|uniref:Endonuclease 8-like 1 n=1 Tax=Lingula anatina TaxID=7574 RepID=A0A1S3HV72_LINAN|nr:endonuclease 8-like 1 [Lingula anatina]|eukprot:XP_013389919.1 endonuclease 8-like 1 [Lingula anatina]